MTLPLAQIVVPDCPHGCVIWSTRSRHNLPNPCFPGVADLDEELLRHNKAAFGWALACCHWNRAAAEDVLQTSYLKVLDGRARYGGQSEFRAFLFGVIRRTAMEERRRRAVRSVLTLGLSTTDHADPSSNGLDPIVRDETSRQLLAALEKVSSRQRDVLHLVFYQDLTIAAAAEVLGISVGSARVHYERGKAHLRRLLGES
jgi:RNA polymerase sigma-70 factor, ECF subfamily